jgi:predicted XRE-type DNA-binding protein
MEEERSGIVTASSGNIFQDLGLPDPDIELAKAQLVRSIGHALKTRGQTQAELAKLVQLDQPKISRLLRGHTDGFSIERLMTILRHLDYQVTLAIHPPATEPALAREKVSAKPALRRAVRKGSQIEATKIIHGRKWLRIKEPKSADREQV